MSDWTAASSRHLEAHHPNTMNASSSLPLLNVRVHGIVPRIGVKYPKATSGCTALWLDFWGEPTKKFYKWVFKSFKDSKFSFLLSESQATNGFEETFISGNLPALCCLCCFLFKLETHLLHSRCFKMSKQYLCWSFIHNSCITPRESLAFFHANSLSLFLGHLTAMGHHNCVCVFSLRVVKTCAPRLLSCYYYLFFCVYLFNPFFFNVVLELSICQE